MLITLLCLSVLMLIAVSLLAGRMAHLDAEISGMRADITAMRSAVSPQMLGSRGGRQVPTLEELSAARNRIDAQGVAHPGSG